MRYLSARQAFESGHVLLAVLIMFMAISLSATSFIWFMNQQQTYAGRRYQDVAALYAAEGGIQRVLAALESASQDDGPGRSWRPRDYAEPFESGPLKGRFTVSVEGNGDGSLVVTSEGVVGSATRRLQARVSLASPALLAALYGASVVQFERPTATVVILPYGRTLTTERWVHVAAGEAIRFVDTGASAINAPVTFEVPVGPLEALDRTREGCRAGGLRPARLLLANDAELMVSKGLHRVDLQQLRAQGFHLDGHLIEVDRFPSPPQVDRNFYSSLAAANTANAEINRLAGQRANNRQLAQRRNSLYQPQEMIEILRYDASRRSPTTLRGLIYVAGGLELADGSRLAIVDGALVAERSIFIGEKAELTITHTPQMRTFPGLLVLDQGGLMLDEKAKLKAHGLVYVSRSLDIGQGAVVELVGALLAKDPMLSVRNDGGQILICYDQAVLGTPGLRVGADEPIIAWVSDWREVGR